MRLVLVAIFLILYTIFTIPMALVLWIIGKFDERKKEVVAQVCVKGGFKAILFLSGVRLTVKGKENIVRDGAALYAYNHRGFFDILVGYTTAPMPTPFISKKEIEKVPMISWWMKYLNCLFLDRDDIRQGMKVILTGIELMKEGTNIFIAPEGTRNSSDELLPFHEASFKLAEKSKSPIVPVAMNNMDAVLEQHMPWIRRTHVIIEYCEPIYMDSMERAEKKKIGEKVRQIISDKIKENAAEV